MVIEAAMSQEPRTFQGIRIAQSSRLSILLLLVPQKEIEERLEK